jgi:5-methylcytosine-specific restriction endonuclease McrBC GTP-binding regulatory subunit McrB
MSTDFLDTLLDYSHKAKNHPEKLYFICLDEMNLAHIEYYFAEFLSVLQDKDEHRICLYSKHLREDILREISAYVQGMPGVMDIEDKDLRDFVRQQVKAVGFEERRYWAGLIQQARML